ncbi:MAG: homoserine O-acetyltransferase [Balneolaceae bacterium]
MNRDITITKLEKPFVTEAGHTFYQADAAYKTWGRLNEKRDNAILICHALTGHAAADEWFPGIIGDRALCDPEQYFVICINVPGSCYGSVGPLSTNPANGQPYRSDFPNLTIRDLVSFQQLLLDQLDVEGIELVIGGSMGGMQALEFALMDKRVRAAIPMAMGMAHTAWAIGISHVQRQAITGDPQWNGGNYPPEQPPGKGLATARMMAMISYRSPADYQHKFGREKQHGLEIFQVESYLSYQGDKLVDRFDANTYITLTKAMDTHDVSRGRGTFSEVLGDLEIPVLVIGVDTDFLYPTQDQKELAGFLQNGTYAEIESIHGHDAFLIEFEQLNRITTEFISTNRKPETQ